MNDLTFDLFPPLSVHLNDLPTNITADTNKSGLCDPSENIFFTGHATSSCKPLDDLIIKGNNHSNHQQLKTNKPKPTINKRIINPFVSAQNPSTHSRKSGSVIQPALSQNETDKLSRKKMKESIRKADYRKTPKGRLVARKASKKYRSTEKGKKTNAAYQAEYKKTQKGMISSIISNAKSNTKVSALRNGFSMTEAKILGAEAAENKKAELLELYDIPWLKTQPR